MPHIADAMATLHGTTSASAAMEEDKTGLAGAKRKEREEWHDQDDDDGMDDSEAGDDDDEGRTKDWDRWRARRLVRAAGSGGDSPSHPQPERLAPERPDRQNPQPAAPGQPPPHG
eukprot:688436-Pyramimonas_sp.AAC.1